MTRDGGVGEDRDGSSSIGGGRPVWASKGSHIPIQKMLPHPNCHHLQTTHQKPEEAAPKASTPEAREAELAPKAHPQLHHQFGGGYPCPHDTPSPAIGGIERVYKCWVEGCSDGPSTLWPTICAYVCRDHLRVRLACPSCAKTFLNSDALRCQRKIHVNQ